MATILTSLHEHEEKLRARSLATIEAAATLSEHWNMVAEAMNVIFAFTHDHKHGSENELILQLLGIRLFNAAGASIKVALSGYYQKAFDDMRDVIETGFLVDYLSTYPGKIDEWRSADRKTRMSRFGAGHIRNELDKRDGYTKGRRKKIYDLISEYASHASYGGISLTTSGSDNLAQVGPFFDETKLEAWLHELAMRLSEAALVLVSNAEGNDSQFETARRHYNEVAHKWGVNYLGICPKPAD